MDSARDSSESEEGFNLDNYFPTKRTHNSVVYIHKKFLSEYKGKLRGKYASSEVHKTRDKCQQFDENVTTEAYKFKEAAKNKARNDPVLDQAVKFAKQIIPLTIPPTSVSPHPEYTIKTFKKCKKRASEADNVKCKIVNNTTYNKEKSKQLLEHFKRDKLKRHRDSISPRETVSSSQNNTLDDINENRTLSCTLSEISERKQHKEDRHCKRNKQNEMQKVAVSESFEAVATEFMNTSNDTKIKIHLMNERDKNLFCENIQTPVTEALKDCIMELNKQNAKTMQLMQTSIERQAEKIDVILNKLKHFEEKLNVYTRTRSPMVTETGPKLVKTSKLEELGQNIVQVEPISSTDEEELGQIDLTNKSVKTSIEKMNPQDKSEDKVKRIDNLGCGEEIPTQSRTQLGVKPERLNRKPARFCWTDAGKKT